MLNGSATLPDGSEYTCICNGPYYIDLTKKTIFGEPVYYNEDGSFCFWSKVSAEMWICKVKHIQKLIFVLSNKFYVEI